MLPFRRLLDCEDASCGAASCEGVSCGCASWRSASYGAVSCDGTSCDCASGESTGMQVAGGASCEIATCEVTRV